MIVCRTMLLIVSSFFLQQNISLNQLGMEVKYLFTNQNSKPLTITEKTEKEVSFLKLLQMRLLFLHFQATNHYLKGIQFERPKI